MVNGVSFNPMAVDCNGDIRYSIQLRTNSIGMIPLAGGRFLYEDRTANRMNKKGQIKPCRYWKIMKAPVVNYDLWRKELWVENQNYIGY